MVLCLLPLAACSILLMLLTNSHALMITALVCYGFFGKLATDPLTIALVADNTPRNQLSTAFGIFNFVGMSSAIIAPYATGCSAISRVPGTAASMSRSAPDFGYRRRSLHQREEADLTLIRS